jgi:hypothetical protein
MSEVQCESGHNVLYGILQLVDANSVCGSVRYVKLFVCAILNCFVDIGTESIEAETFMAPGEPAETNTLLMDYVDYVETVCM